MTLKFSMEKQAKSFLKKKGSILTISKMGIARGCMTFEDLDFSYKKPKSDHYNRYEFDDITIFIQRGIAFDGDRVKIVVTGIGPLKSISAGNLKRTIARL